MPFEKKEQAQASATPREIRNLNIETENNIGAHAWSRNIKLFVRIKVSRLTLYDNIIRLSVT